MELERKLGELAEDLYRPLSRLALVQRRGDTSRGVTANLSPAQLSMLYVLRDQGPIRMAELAAHERVKAPSITVAIHLLVKLGLVQRFGDACDRRLVLLDLTPRGLAVLRQSVTNQCAALVAILAELSESDRETLTMALAPLDRLADQPASSLGPGRRQRVSLLGAGRRPQP